MSLDIKSWLLENRGDVTLLCICPASVEIVEASIKEASHGYFIPMFVATPRQVDADRGYTGWSQKDLVEFVRSTSKKLGYTGPFLVARDHGGPYQSNRDRGRPEVSLDKAMSYAKETFAQDLRSGFSILHIDATEDSSRREPLELDEVAQRTAEIIVYIEGVREREGLPGVYYEVGTEEISGGITEPDNFEKFIRLLKSELVGRGHGQAIKQLLFIVGQVGTTMRIDMTNHFDPKMAETLVGIASRHDLFLKVHYADWIEATTLEQFPRLGIGAANVGPEFAAAIVEALGELEKKEVQALRGAGKKIRSHIIETIEDAAIKGAPWRRFAPKGLKNQELEVFAKKHRREIALCVGRYIMENPEVVEARQKLYENLRGHSSMDDPHQFVVAHVQKAIHRYVRSFNLRNKICKIGKT